MSQEQIQAIERDIEEAKVHIDLASALERLDNNQDFRKVIGTAYCKDEAIRLVHLKSDPEMQSPERQASIIRQIDAIGALSGFLRIVKFHGAQAAKNIAAAEEMLVELRQEGN